MARDTYSIKNDVNDSPTLIVLGYWDEDLLRETALSVVRILSKEKWNIKFSRVILTWWDPQKKWKTEAEKMKDILDKYPSLTEDTEVILEDSSINTQENMKFSSKIISHYSSNVVVLLWEKSHLTRAKRDAENEGININHSFATQDILSPMVLKPKTLTVRHTFRHMQESFWFLKELIPQSAIDFIKKVASK